MRSKMILYRFNENENHRGVNLASWGNFLGYLKKVDSTHGHISLHIPKFECKYHSMYWNYIKWYNDRAKILSAFRKIFKKVEQIFYEEKFAFLWIEKFRWASIPLNYTDLFQKYSYLQISRFSSYLLRTTLSSPLSINFFGVTPAGDRLGVFGAS